jgi:hypothetical protein
MCKLVFSLKKASHDSYIAVDKYTQRAPQVK